MPPKKTYMSGAEKRKRKKRIDELVQSQAGSMNKFVTKKQKESSSLVEDLESNEQENMRDMQNEQENISDVRNEEQENMGGDHEPNECLNESDHEAMNDEGQNEDLECEYGPINVDDPSNWDKIDQKFIDFKVERGPSRRYGDQFPEDKDGRHFTSFHYTRHLPNREKQDRRWLVYSGASDKVFCFCCKLFAQGGNKTVLLATKGLSDWRNIGQRLQSHEGSSDHVACMRKWAELERRLKRNETIDQHVQDQINNEKEHWKGVLVRIIEAVKAIAKLNLAFRGENEKIYEERNGIFLSILQMVAVYDPIMKEHFRRVQKGEIHYHYLSHKIQNEIIQLLARDVKSAMISKIKDAKYFAVILDCTPDISHQEQMSLVVRCVDVAESPPKVKEFFLEFLKVEDTTGSGLFGELEEVLATLQLDIGDARGQGFNQAMDYFEKTCFRSLSLKPLSQTRWESRVESVRAIRYQTSEIKDALLELADSPDEAAAKSEAEGLVRHEIEDFGFLVGMVVWHTMLFAVNAVSKIMQKKDMHIDVAIDQMNGLITFFTKYREIGLVEAINEAKDIASTLGVEPVFREKRDIRRKKHFDENVSEKMTRSAVEIFKCDCFLYLVDQAISSLGSRFEQFKEYEETWGFLFDVNKLNSMTDECLKMYCSKLENALKHEETSDIDHKELFSELKVFKEGLPREIRKPIEVLNHLKLMEDCYPNVWIAYRILLTIPVTVASGERSFSKLKLIKNYLRSTMSQERLNGLSILSIEHELADKIDCADIITTFASKTARRMMLKEG